MTKLVDDIVHLIKYQPDLFEPHNRCLFGIKSNRIFIDAYLNIPFMTVTLSIDGKDIPLSLSDGRKLKRAVTYWLKNVRLGDIS